MAESHCGELPARMLDPLVLAQPARDAGMAARLLGAGERGGILVTGNGHARTDRGVPAYLRADAPGRRTVSLAFLEVVPGKDDPAAYGEGLGAAALPYDYAVFTPGEAREDPCEGRRHHARAREKREKEKDGQGPR